MIKVLNLYAGIGGNRKLWTDVDVTAVELNPEIAKIYRDFFPDDKVIVVDAHEYLLHNYKEFDFIWSSPPCQSHSSFRQNICVRFRGTKSIYPNMKLYEEILFLQYNAGCKWVVENVRPYYKALIEANRVLNRHLYWCNFNIADAEFKKDIIRKSQIPDFEEKYNYDLSEYKIKNKRQILRNCVEPKMGLHIFNEFKRAGCERPGTQKEHELQDEPSSCTAT